MQDETIRPRAENTRQALPPPSVIFGSTTVLRIVREKLESIADTSVPVLVEGESGVGKEVVAKYLHENSNWADGPFLKIHCPALTPSEGGAEVFAREKNTVVGSWTPVTPQGTLFFDEISELDASLQSKLVQVLQDSGCCHIVQGGKPIRARLVCATNRNLEDEVKAERFRRDLFYRISGARIVVPPLRKRAVDMAVLTDYFVDVYNQQFKRRARPISTSLLHVLASYSWPGNIRELENVIRRYVLFGNEDAIHGELTAWMPEKAGPERVTSKPVGLKEMSRQAARKFEAELITKVLDANHWNRKQAARALKISYRALLYKLKESGIRAR